MRSFVLAVAVLFSVPVFAQDAGTADSGVAVTVMPSVAIVGSPVMAPDAGVSVPMGTVEASGLLKTVFTSVKEGNWWMAAAAFLVLVVGLLRGIGKKFHEWLPDNNVLDKPLIFLYDTKIGGWILNWLTALGGGVGTAMAAGVPVDFSLWKSVVIVATSGSAIFELYKDIKEWWLARAAKKAAATPAPAPAEPPKA